MQTRPIIATVVALASAVAVSSCSDDKPTAPDTTPSWTEEALPAGLEMGYLSAITVSGDRAVAVGTRSADFSPFAVERTNEGWELLELPEVPFRAIPAGVVLTEAGDPIIVGVAIDEGGGFNAFIIDGRTEPASLIEFDRDNEDVFLYSVAVGDGAAMAVGLASGGFALRSVTAGAWTDVPPSPIGQQELGLNDVQYVDGRFVACGFDDGGPPYAIFATYENRAWSMDEIPGVDLDPRCLEELPDGTLLVGGQRFESSTSSDYAFLQARDPGTNAWIPLGVPGSPRPGTVQDLYATSSGEVRAALSTWSANVPGGIVRSGRMEYELSGAIVAIAGSANGTLYAVGHENLAGGDLRPVLLVREP
ncbi:MAG: hypothetical protein H6682_13145 [Candidatus Eisenbacteria bacterium]|nr:hypothetical protein [Candidatus Eisenbacteria bacterium]